MEYLSVKEVAELKGCSEQYIKKLAKDGKLESKTELNEKNRPKYLIPISALPEPLQKKYYGKLTADAQLCLPKVQETAVPQKPKHTKPVVKKEFGEFNADEREQITFWTDLLREWQIRRKEYENYAEGDMVFIAETKRLRRAYLAEHGITLSRDILYRKYKAYKDKNAGDEYVEGFNEALAQLRAAIAAEQDFAAASTAPKRYSETDTQASAGSSSGSGTFSDRIVIQNHIEVDMDGEKVAEKVIEKEEIINYRKDV